MTDPNTPIASGLNSVNVIVPVYGPDGMPTSSERAPYTLPIAMYAGHAVTETRANIDGTLGYSPEELQARIDNIDTTGFMPDSSL